VRLVNRSNPMEGSSAKLKLFQPRLRYPREVRSKSAGSRPALSRPQLPMSREVTRPSASPQCTPAHPQQSVPIFHDRNAVVESVVAVNECLSRSSAVSWSRRHGNCRATVAAAVLLPVSATADEGRRSEHSMTTRWICSSRCSASTAGGP